MARRPPNWKVVEDVKHKKFSNGGVIVVEDDHDVIHFDNSSDLALSTSLNDLDFATLHIDGQSMDVDTPPDIIGVDEDDDIIDDEDAIPHDLEDFNDKDLFNVDDDDDDDVAAMSADVTRGHVDNGGSDDHPLSHQIGGGCRGKGTQKPNLGGRKSGRLNTRKETRNPGLRKITDQFGPQATRFEWSDRGTLMPLDDHAAHWANLLGEIIWEFPMHFHGQSTEVDVPPDIIIDIVDEDDDITDDEDAIPYDLAKSDNEDLINVDDDGVDKVYSCEEED
uniref:Uncharacterized protein n=1 Tax=Tanacetum cinerariifolium TaxID=118510 RepID=A0A699KA21_TANCI|nr:hypothetical protein [Tanacetum cinerariifolium]